MSVSVDSGALVVTLVSTQWAQLLIDGPGLGSPGLSSFSRSRRGQVVSHGATEGVVGSAILIVKCIYENLTKRFLFFLKVKDGPCPRNLKLVKLSSSLS